MGFGVGDAGALSGGVGFNGAVVGESGICSAMATFHSLSVVNERYGDLSFTESHFRFQLAIHRTEPIIQRFPDLVSG